jgi:ribulose kinase
MTSFLPPESQASPSDHKNESFFLGIDVGTGSARDGVFSESGKMLATATRKTAMWRPQAEFVEQSSENIWQSCVDAVRTAVSESGIDPTRVGGIGFDATCSLVALDAAGQPVSVSPTGRDEQNIIVEKREGMLVLALVGGQSQSLTKASPHEIQKRIVRV